MKEARSKQVKTTSSYGGTEVTLQQASVLNQAAFFNNNISQSMALSPKQARPSTIPIDNSPSRKSVKELASLF